MNCSEIFTPVITDTGVCCAFNGHVSFVESQYSELVKEMQVIDLPFFFIFISFISIFLHLFDLSVTTSKVLDCLASYTAIMKMMAEIADVGLF